MKISLIHPSRGRAEKAKKTFDFWNFMASGQHEIEHVLSLDLDDHQVAMYKNLFPPERSSVVVSSNSCVVEATNIAAKISTGDILVYLSDDFKCPKDWDLLILDRMMVEEKQLLRVNDGYQPMENDVLTIPIMTRKLYDFLKYFWYPEYRSMWVDVDLFFTCKPFMIVAPDLIFMHEHPVTGKCQTDDTYRRSNLNWDSGKAIIERRSKEFGWEGAFKKMP